MTEEQRIAWLLELQDHPERLRVGDETSGMQLTDEQVQQILADDEMRLLVRQLGFAKRAFKHDELKNDAPDVDSEWEKFVEAHPQPLPKGGGRPVPYLKIAASFIGVLLASGIAFAAIQVVRNISTPKPQQPTKEQMTDINPVTSLPADTVQADTIPVEPYIFNNVPLDSMLTAIATAHGVGVEFENEAASHLRFHFVWKREDCLSRVVEKLNTFEAVNIGMEDKTLVVK